MPFQIENLVSYAWLVFNRFYHAPWEYEHWHDDK